MSETESNRICVLGMGYVGLTLAVVMADHGFTVTGAEINPKILAALQEGRPHFHEVGLRTRLERVMASGKLRFVQSIRSIPNNDFDIFILTVGTPLNAEGKPRMDMVMNATREVAEVMQPGAMVVLRSTVQIGTSRNVVLPILEGTGKPFNLAYCPERTIEGKALEELTTLPQIVGGLDSESAWRATRTFQRLTPTTIRVSSLEAAETIKLLDNSQRDLYFAFGNEVAMLCDALGLDGIEIIQAANRGYERTNIAMPGLVGGPCLEKDPHILEHSLRGVLHVPQLISTGRRLNEALPSNIVDMILEEPSMADGLVTGRPINISICGLAFKGRPETDDVRGTPAKFLIEALRERFPNANLRGQDFAVSNDSIASFGLSPVSIEEAFQNAHLVIVANNNPRYQWLDIDHLLATMSNPGIVFDCWNCLAADRLATPEGITYLRLGSARAWRQTRCLSVTS